MLRLPAFDLRSPRTVAEAVRLLSENETAMVVAGGTDVLPNLKHELFAPGVLVSLEDIEGLSGLRTDEDGTLVIGAMTRLDDIASSAVVRERAPALGQAVSLIAGPQLRTMGTLGGNVLLDTRCQWYNQTYFWRKSLGFCLKKDGSACHVVAGGSKCVAAASNDSVPALMTLGAGLIIEGPRGRREVGVDDFWRADGIWNKKFQRDEVLVEIRVPAQAAGHRGAYAKLRDRGSIDFPLLGVAARVDLAADAPGAEVIGADLVVTALAARPLRIAVSDDLVGTRPGTDSWRDAVAGAAEVAYKRCHPLPNVPGDHEYRREMVPVAVRRVLEAAVTRSGPVHPI